MQICIVLYLILSCFTYLHNAPNMEEKKQRFVIFIHQLFTFARFAPPPQCLLIEMTDGYIDSNVTIDKRHRRY